MTVQPTPADDDLADEALDVTPERPDSLGSRGSISAGRMSTERTGGLRGTVSETPDTTRQPDAPAAAVVPPADRAPLDAQSAPGDGSREAGSDKAGVHEAGVEGSVKRGDLVADPIGERVQTGFQDLSRLLGAIKETLQSRDGQVQQTLQALPTFLQQVPRIHQAEIECLAEISKQLEHMGTGTRDVLARLDGLPDLLRTLALGQAEQQQFLEGLQAKMSEHLDVQGQAIREGLDTQRRNAEAQLGMIRSIATTQEEVFSTFQNTQNRALNVFHRAQQNTMAQHKETQQVMNRQVEMLVERVHSAQTKIFWLSIGFAALATVGLVVALVL